MINIYMKNIDIEDFKQYVKQIYTYNTLCKRYNICLQTCHRIIKDNNIDISHFDKSNYKRGIFKNDIRICPICKKEFECKSYSKQKYCSIRCSSKNYIPTEETKIRISNTLKYRLNIDGKWGALTGKKKRNFNKKEYIQKICPVCKTEFKTYIKQNNIYCSRKCFKEDKHCLYRVKLGGYVAKSGHGRKGYYKGFWCDSTYELVYIIYCLDHNIDIQRNRKGYEYFHNNEKHIYYPDFIVNGIITEIKGYYTPLVDIKAAAVPDLKILYKKDLKNIFEYIKERYNKTEYNLSDLYDNVSIE